MRTVFTVQVTETKEYTVTAYGNIKEQIDDCREIIENATTIDNITENLPGDYVEINDGKPVDFEILITKEDEYAVL